MEEKRKITKQEVQEYIQENFDTFFVDALAKYILNAMSPDPEDRLSPEEYREDLKQLIWEGIAHGVKEYLDEYEHSYQFMEKLASEMVGRFLHAHKRISVSFE